MHSTDYVEVPFVVRRDDDMRPYQVAFDASDLPVVVGDWTLLAEIKVSAADAEAVDTFILAADTDPEDPTVIVVTFGLTDVQSRALFGASYVWDLQTVSPSGVRWTPVGGPLTVLEDVTR